VTWWSVTSSGTPSSEEVIEHILYLEGVPNMQRLGTVQVVGLENYRSEQIKK
jgi:bacterioferritin (cytochrome b1)